MLVFYQRELTLLENTLKKYRVASTLVRDGEATESPFLLDEKLLTPEAAEPRTLYKTVDAYGFGYLYFLLPARRERALLRIGPYQTEARGSGEYLEILEQMGIPPKRQKYMREYLDGIPVLPEGHPLFLLVDAFCEQVWETDTFALVDLKSDPLVPLFSDGALLGEENAAVEIQTMEKRYAFENELLEAVSGGQLQKENRLLFAISENLFEKRVADPLRNAKNYGIIMNTLLRKAAERGGVHPLYLDRASSAFAARIEALASLSESGNLMRDMFRGYCRLVRKHATGRLTPVVQKAVLLIDADISVELTLSAVAKTVGVSESYLSAAFKRETGKTLTEYVRHKRISYAKKLLETTHLQIQTVAGHCGIVDVQYFSKMFKAETGKTPLEYRKFGKGKANG